MKELERLKESMDSSERHFAEDYDVAAAVALKGAERDDAIELLVKRLDAGADPRAPRCLGSMGATEALTELFIAASTAQPTTRIEAALAHEKIAGPTGIAVDTAVAVLAAGTASAQILALRALSDAKRRDLLEQTALSHASADVRGRAFALWLGTATGRNTPAHALSQRITAGPLALAKAAGPELATLDPAAAAADTSTAPFPDLQKSLMDGKLTAADLTTVGASEQALLIAWSAWCLGDGRPAAVAQSLAIGLPGARAALEELRADAEGAFLTAIEDALA